MIEGAQQLRGYELRTRLGSSPGVTLHLGRQSSSSREVGLQLLEPSLFHLPGFVNRLGAVVAQVAPLRHPRVVGTEEVATGDDTAALVTEAAVAVPLSDLLAEGESLPVPTAMAVVDDVLVAVGAAHAASLVHCGITPDRVLVDAHGRAHLDGFAMARALALTGGELGAPAPGYSSPERLGGVLPDGQGDLYAIAALAHRLLTGTVPSPGAAAPVPALPALSAVLAQELAPEPQRRFPNAAALRHALIHAVEQALGAGWRQSSDLPARAQERLRALGLLPPGATAPAAPAPAVPARPAAPAPSSRPLPPVRRRRRRWRTLLAMLAGLLVIAGAAGAAVWAVRGSGGAPASTTSTPGPLTVGNDVTLTMDKTQTGDCLTDYVFTAGGSLSGRGALTYHWEQSDGYRTTDTTIQITDQTGMAIAQHWRFEGHRTGSATMTFVITAPQMRTASKTFDTTCP